jgi:hypothetical protein
VIASTSFFDGTRETSDSSNVPSRILLLAREEIGDLADEHVDGARLRCPMRIRSPPRRTHVIGRDRGEEIVRVPKRTFPSR